MEGLGIAANVIAVVDISVKILQVCSQYAKEVKNATADREQLEQEIETLHGTAEKVKTLIESPQGASLKASQGFAKKLSETIGVLSEVKLKLEPPTKPSFRHRSGLKSLEWPFQSGQVHRIVQRIHKCSDSLSLALQVDEITLLLGAGVKLDQTKAQVNTTHSKLDIAHHKLDETHSKLDKVYSCLHHVVNKVDKVDTGLGIAGLPTAAGAAYNSYAEQDNSTCLQNTRSEILEDIDNWLGDETSHSIFWLQGMAGTGKSTIARTMATAWDKRRQLGASFFFKRGGGDRGNLSCFFTTVASQMATSTPELSTRIQEAIDKDPLVTSKMAEEQFDKLILQPILTLQPQDRRIIAIVVDALDECDGDANIKRLLNTMTRAGAASNVRIKFLITSRPELHIRLGFRTISGSYQDFVLHEIPESIIWRDIEIFLSEGLRRIRDEYNISVEDNRKLAETWPSPESIKTLVEKAVPLFIFAATVCRFISQRRSASPETQLQKVLALETKSLESKMNTTYLPSLEQQLEDLSLREQDEAIADFHRVVGTIITLKTPLAVPALARIIGIAEDMIHNRLDMLHSVLNYPKTIDTPVTLLHLSFRDFLLDPEKKGVNRFWIDEEQVHGQISAGCLRILNAFLKEDICSLVAPGTNRAAVPISHIACLIPTELQYACRYWVQHLGKAAKSSIHSPEILDFFASHLLHFLECLSLMGHLSELYDMLYQLQDFAKEGDYSSLNELLTDIVRFLRMNFTIIDEYPLQLYSSLRHTIQSSSPMHHIFTKSTPCWISQLPNTTKEWGQYQQLLEGHKTRIQALSFSKDGTHMVSSSRDGNIRVWRLDTGQCIRDFWIAELESTSSYISVSTSSNTLWVLGQDYRKLRLWCGDTAELVAEFKIASHITMAPQLSPCAQYCAFIDHSRHLVLLHLGQSSQLRQVYLEDSETICGSERIEVRECLSFSCDSKRLAFFSTGDRGTYFLWDIESRKCINKYQQKENFNISHDGFCNRKTSIGLCDDGPMVAFSPRYGQIDIRWLFSGRCVQTFKGHKGGIDTMSFLNNCKRLGSSCSEGEVRTWDIETGGCLNLVSLYVNPSIMSTFAISADYRMACSCHGTQTISITENARNGLPVSTSISLDFVRELSLSTDATVAASTSIVGVIKIWDFHTGACISEIINSGYDYSPLFTPNFEYVVLPAKDSSTVGPSKEIEVWDTTSALVIGHFTLAMADRTFVNSRPSYSEIQKGRDIAISPNSCLIALVSYDTLRVSPVHGGATTHTVKSPGHIFDVMFSSDSTLLGMVSSKSINDSIGDHQSYTELVSIYDIEKSEIIGAIELSRVIIRILDISFSSKQLALHTKGVASESDERIAIVDISTKRLIREFNFGGAAFDVVVDRDTEMCAWREMLRPLTRWSLGNTLTGRTTYLGLYSKPKRINLNAGSDLVSTSIGDLRVDRLQKNKERSRYYERMRLEFSDEMAWLSWFG